MSRIRDGSSDGFDDSLLPNEVITIPFDTGGETSKRPEPRTNEEAEFPTEITYNLPPKEDGSSGGTVSIPNPNHPDFDPETAYEVVPEGIDPNSETITIVGPAGAEGQIPNPWYEAPAEEEDGDSDGDGVPDSVEIDIGTDPFSYDDGLISTFERPYPWGDPFPINPPPPVDPPPCEGGKVRNTRRKAGGRRRLR